jgi:hypothetical protein
LTEAEDLRHGRQPGATVTSPATPILSNLTYINHQPPPRTDTSISAQSEEQIPERSPASIIPHSDYESERDVDEDRDGWIRDVAITNASKYNEASTSNDTRDRILILHARSLQLIAGMGLINHANATTQ